jgi:hypothetical protein
MEAVMDLPCETHAEPSTGVREILGRISEKLGGGWLVWRSGGSSPDVLALLQYRDEETPVPYDRRRTTLRRW